MTRGVEVKIKNKSNIITNVIPNFRWSMRVLYFKEDSLWVGKTKWGPAEKEFPLKRDDDFCSVHVDDNLPGSMLRISKVCLLTNTVISYVDICVCTHKCKVMLVPLLRELVHGGPAVQNGRRMDVM